MVGGPIRPADRRIGALCRRIEFGFELCPRRLQHTRVGIRRHSDDLSAHDQAAPERQRDHGAIPILQPDETAGDDHHRDDRPPALARQHDDAEPGLARHLRHVRRQRHVGVGLKRPHHFLEGGDAALAMEGAAMITGAAHRADAKPRRRQRVDLAVGMARHQHLGAVLRPLQKRHHEVLPVPERDDHRHVWLDDVIDVGRIIAEAVGQPYQPQVFRTDKTGGLLDPGGA
jgi:hypothetical protein